jgi:valyl-tRNA synthetase
MTEMTTEIPKHYDHIGLETRWYDTWESRGYFTADAASPKPAFTVVIPPPNVTGSLHMGHMLNQTIQDVIVRRKRMQGFNTLWLPGTDHAGIATQNVVEKQLRAEGRTRHDLGREEFLKRVWAWKSESGGTITRQVRRLGASCDWTRERFTFDDGLSDAVREVFVSLYDEGLIYRGKRLIHWCPRCRTALSDLEVEYVEVRGRLHHIRYPVRNASSDSIVVATTRPETMLGDTAIAVHPEDGRYAGFDDAVATLPLLGREIGFIRDTVVDREFGTGAVKVTPAHDPNDFEMGQRHGLEQISVIDEDGRMTPAGGPYAGLDRSEARQRIVDDLSAGGFLVDIEDHTHNVGHCSRCRTVVEPLLSTQWFVDVEPLAREAIRAVEAGETRFVPANWAKTYFEWMHNIRDWCISRQLWWGHRIPAWYCGDCGETVVARGDPSSCPKCGGAALGQDEDVLDTWFSSQLWPFSTMGWPRETPDLATFYPTSLLVTAYDIIFFWVARMIMAGKKFTGKAPFAEVYIHGLVRDVDRQKLSKSKGNVGDPLLVCDEYGTDAVRFTLARLGAPGSDLVLAEAQLDSYRAFATKIWNAARFILGHLEEGMRPSTEDDIRSMDLSVADRWIISRYMRVVESVNESLDRYFLHEGARGLYQFFWHEFCDWYLEMTKLHPEKSRPVLGFVLEGYLRLLHPFMPFITEELWQRVPHEGESIVVAPYPAFRADLVDAGAEADVALLEEIIVKVRNIRAEMNVDVRATLPLRVAVDGAGVGEMILQNQEYVRRLARVESVEIVSALIGEKGSARAVAGSVTLEVPLSGVIDLDAERARLTRDLVRVDQQIADLDRKLSNPQFVERAPEAVVQENRQRLADYRDQAQRLRDGLARLS